MSLLNIVLGGLEQLKILFPMRLLQSRMMAFYMFTPEQVLFIPKKEYYLLYV